MTWRIKVIPANAFDCSIYSIPENFLDKKRLLQGWNRCLVISFSGIIIGLKLAICACSDFK